MANLGERGGRNKDSQPRRGKGPEGTRMGRGRDRSRDGTGVTRNCSKKAQTGPEGAEEKGRKRPEGAEEGTTAEKARECRKTAPKEPDGTRMGRGGGSFRDGTGVSQNCLLKGGGMAVVTQIANLGKRWS